MLRQEKLRYKMETCSSEWSFLQMLFPFTSNEIYSVYVCENEHVCSYVYIYLHIINYLYVK